MLTNVLRASTIDNFNLESRVNTLLFYNFLITIPNKHSVTPMETLLTKGLN